MTGIEMEGPKGGGKEGNVVIINPAADGVDDMYTKKEPVYAPVEDPSIDAYDVCNEILEEDPDTTPWADQTMKERAIGILIILLKMITVLCSLYLFVCSLSFLSDSFKILSGKTAGSVFSNSEILKNPIVGLMIGVLVTVLVQSSSTSTSIIVAMIASEIVEIEPAIYMVMGANIGTTVTNTIVSFGQSMDKTMFRRAFAGATVHDCFNWLCVAIFLPLEAIFHPLLYLSSLVVKGIKDTEAGSSGTKLDFLKKLTAPFTKIIVRVNKSLITKIAEACADVTVARDCDCECEKAKSMIKTCKDDKNLTINCGFLFSDTGMGDTLTGVILLVLSLILLCTCLTVLVKTLQSLLLGSLARTLKRYINSDLPYPFGWLTGYIFMVVGVGMTILVQSSSVFTSTLTPLVGMGVISVDRMFPLTLGSNIGTTGTAMLAAFAADSNYHNTIQIAVCHLFFNIAGIILFFPVPFMRRIPIAGAKILGNITANYRWFAIAYLLIVFLIIPVTLIGLSFNKYVFGVVISLVLLLALLVIVVNLAQKYYKPKLPLFLRDWSFVPEPLRSLAPYDRVIMSGIQFFRDFREKKSSDPTDIKYVKDEEINLPEMRE